MMISGGIAEDGLSKSNVYRCEEEGMEKNFEEESMKAGEAWSMLFADQSGLLALVRLPLGCCESLNYPHLLGCYCILNIGFFQKPLPFMGTRPYSNYEFASSTTLQWWTVRYDV